MDKLNYKVCVYGICKNEALNAEKWCKLASEADIIIVGDTGSTDNTVEILKKNGVNVYILDVDYFRFDECRNKVLAKIPEDVDICVSMDFDDEINAGWRKQLENAWDKNTKKASCKYNWSHNADGTPAISYEYPRIHARHNFKWFYPVHEVLEYIGKGIAKNVFINEMEINHNPDNNKDRRFYLELLELAVKENPNSSRNLHYLGREYMFVQKWDKCIVMQKKYLSLPTSLWDEERSAAMRFIARSYKAKEDFYNAKNWLHKAIAETPNLREPYIDLAIIAHLEKDWVSMYYYSSFALRIKEKHLGYVNEIYAWNFNPYDLVAISAYWLGLKNIAIENSEIAMKLSPDNSRLINNHKYYVDINNYPKPLLN